MAVWLSSEHDRGRQALLTHALRKWFVKSGHHWAVVFYFVRYVLFKSAILALLVRQVLIFAFAQALSEVVVVALMLDKLVVLLGLRFTLLFLP